MCRRLDGLPLAVELAAARMAVLGPEELDARLGSSPGRAWKRSAGRPRRQQTLRATLEWSHRLLSAPEAEAFARFAVFAGGATVETAEEVTGADVEALEGLVEKNLLLRESGRLLMLETVRAYADELLERDNRSSEVRLRHCRHFVAFAETCGPASPHPRRSGVDAAARRGDRQLQGGTGLGSRAKATRHWRCGSPVGSGSTGSSGVLRWKARRWLRAAIEAADDEVPLEDRARALRAEVVMLEEQGSWYDAGGVRGRPAEHRLRGRLPCLAAPETRLESPTPSCTFSGFDAGRPRARAGAGGGGTAVRSRGRRRGLIADALSLRALSFPIVDVDAEIAEIAALYRKVGDVHGLASLYNNAGYVAITEGSYERAAAYLDEALVLGERSR